jgi:hypothetical protein
MAISPGYYSQSIAYRLGEMIDDAVSVEYSIEDKTTEVETIANNWSGITPGPQKAILRFTSACKVGDTMAAKIKNDQDTKAFVEYSMQDIGNGDRLKVKGHILNFTKKAGVGSNAEYSWEVHGANLPL